MSKNPYDILEVSKTASDEDIKAAYRKFAKKYHPDLNPDNKTAEDKFKKISAAYAFLTNKEKRAAFDRGEIDAEGQPIWSGGPHTGAGDYRKYYRDFADAPGGKRYHYSSNKNVSPEDLEDILGSMFGGHTSGASFKDHFQQQKADVHYRLNIDFTEAALGSQKQVTMPDGKSLKINILEGVKEGQKLRLKGQGQKLQDGSYGDAYVEIHILSHKPFTRILNDIHSVVSIGIHEAILGTAIEVETIHGSVKLKIPQKTNSGKKFRLKGKGIKGGDHYVAVQIIMPDKIDKDLEKAIKNWAAKHGYNPRENKKKERV